MKCNYCYGRCHKKGRTVSGIQKYQCKTCEKYQKIKQVLGLMKLLIKKNKIYLVLVCLAAVSCNSGRNQEQYECSDRIDSVVVYTLSKNAECFDCSNYAEIFITLFNKDDKRRNLSFYANERLGATTNFTIKLKDDLYELEGNENHQIIIEPNEKKAVLLMLKEQYLFKNDSSNYTDFVSKLVKEGKLEYSDSLTHNNFEVPKSKNFKLIKLLYK